MLNRVKGWLRSKSRQFLRIDRMDSLQDQVNQLMELKDRIDRLEHIVYSLEESHYRSIGELWPRRDRIFVGGADDFWAIGQEFLGYFKNLCALRPDERVLDIGCGIGRMAIPLTKYLNANGSYEGFDIVRDGIDWCNDNIKPNYTNFHFRLANVFNRLYNPTGAIPAKDYRFPYDDESFDFAFLTSVFTHMLPEDMENYLRESARVLKYGGRCLNTFFLWTQEVARLIDAGKSRFVFKHSDSDHYFCEDNVPEFAVCYNESFVLSLYEKYGLNANLAIHYGTWCGRLNGLSGLDIIVASKK